MNYDGSKPFEIVNYCIFLLQHYHHTAAYQFLYNKYQSWIRQVVKQVYNQFYNLSINETDLWCDSCEILYELVLQFEFTYQVPFLNFLLPRLRWKLLKKIQTNLRTNSTRHNLVYDHTHHLNLATTQSVTTVIKSRQLELAIDLLPALKTRLSDLERRVFDYKRLGLTNRQIMQRAQFTYRQVDNAWQRLKKKLKAYIILMDQEKR